MFLLCLMLQLIRVINLLFFLQNILLSVIGKLLIIVSLVLL